LKLLIAALALAVSTIPASAETWLCVPDARTGFKWNSGLEQWESWSPSVEANYSIERSNDGWLYSGGPFGGVVNCEVAEMSIWIVCRTIITEFHFNPKNGRFFYTYFGGVLSTGYPEFNRGVVDAGTCQRN